MKTEIHITGRNVPNQYPVARVDFVSKEDGTQESSRENIYKAIPFRLAKSKAIRLSTMIGCEIYVNGRVIEL